MKYLLEEVQLLEGVMDEIVHCTFCGYAMTRMDLALNADRCLECGKRPFYESKDLWPGVANTPSNRGGYYGGVKYRTKQGSAEVKFFKREEDLDRWLENPPFEFVEVLEWIMTNESSLIEGAFKPPNDDTIRLFINQYKVSDDPYDVAWEIGQQVGWTEKQIEKAEKIIRRKYIR